MKFIIKKYAKTDYRIVKEKEDGIIYTKLYFRNLPLPVIEACGNHSLIEMIKLYEGE